MHRRSRISNPQVPGHLPIVDIVCMNLAGLTDFSSDASAAALDVSNFFGFFQEGFLYCPFLILLRPIRPSLLPVMQYWSNSSATSRLSHNRPFPSKLRFTGFLQKIFM